MVWEHPAATCAHHPVIQDGAVIGCLSSMLNISFLLLPLGCTVAPLVLSERICSPGEERRLPIVHQPPAAYAGGCRAHSWGQANLQMIVVSCAMSCDEC